MTAPREALDYAPQAEQSQGLGRIGRFCIWFMGFFLTVDVLLLLAGSMMPLPLYYALGFVSVGGLGAGSLAIGVAALGVKEFRWQLLLAVMAVISVLAALLGPLWLKV